MSARERRNNAVNLFFRLVRVGCLIWAFVFGSPGRDATVPPSDLDYRSYIAQDFQTFNPRYNELRAERTRRAFILGRQVFEQEKQGGDTACAHQILLETKWLLDSTADFRRIDKRLDDLERVLSQPENESLARGQDPIDGSWGHCYTEWFFKLDATYDYQKEQKPKYPLRFLDRVSSPQKLRDYIASIEVSEIARDGMNHRRELNESLADLVRLILQDRPAGYTWAPGMKSTILRIVLDEVRNPKTGWWGERFLHNGQIYFVDDLSITFHMLSYLGGKVPDLPKVVGTELALKDLDYPQGWREDGGFSNHNNMDAVVLFHYGWDSATPAQKKIMAQEIEKMLGWCLTESLQSDGSFRSNSDDDSIEEAEYFGTAFLARIGYFDRNRRFWTDQAFPEAEQIRQRIRRYISTHLSTGAAGGAYYQSALDQLDPMKSHSP